MQGSTNHFFCCFTTICPTEMFRRKLVLNSTKICGMFESMAHCCSTHGSMYGSPHGSTHCSTHCSVHAYTACAHVYTHVYMQETLDVFDDQGANVGCAAFSVENELIAGSLRL